MGMDEGRQSFASVDAAWEEWTESHPSWRQAGVAAVRLVAAQHEVFTTTDVWRVWRHHRPADNRAMAAVMDDAISTGLCARAGVVTGHTRNAGHAGYGSRYRSLLGAKLSTPS